MSIQAPCKGCTERHAGCHGDCQKYTDWTNERQAEKQKRIEAFNKQYPYELYRQECITKMYKRKRSRGEL